MKKCTVINYVTGNLTPVQKEYINEYEYFYNALLNNEIENTNSSNERLNKILSRMEIKERLEFNFNNNSKELFVTLKN